MKYVILVGDGMADHPLAELNGKTPLMAADKPGMDYIAAHGVNGMCATVPDGMVPESDTANLAIMGYDPMLTLVNRVSKQHMENMCNISTGTISSNPMLANCFSTEQKKPMPI